ncbi:Cupin domain protein [Mycolicibacterium chubuense]|uniref:Cupin domain protein n=1 Tax=Mycolicibacterium chubuense TaxID=1800 RepID=A0A0J6WJF8_MYCCU|nr:Cupin domain protein [Mycolicibacterium chubuense]SPY00577.1 Cupin domain [Mycolicibacterium chubuense]
MKKMMSLAAVVAAAVPLGLWKASPSSAEGAGVEVSRSDERSAVPGPETTFTGDVSVKPLFEPNASRNFSSAEVSFTPCARTAWHTHPAGQTLIVTSGSGWVQEWGGPRQNISAGDVIWTDPDVKHWHGATAETAMTHIAIQGFVDGRPVDWMEHVSDAQYRPGQ